MAISDTIHFQNWTTLDNDTQPIFQQQCLWYTVVKSDIHAVVYGIWNW